MVSSVKLPWRTIQICTNMLTVATGFCTFLPLGYVSKFFLWQCVLSASIRISEVNMTAKYIVVDNTATSWGSSTDCSYTTYAAVVASIHCFIWCIFFLLMKGQLKADLKEQTIYLVSVVLHAAFTIALFVASGIITAGMNTWCAVLSEALLIASKGASVSCLEAQYFRWSNFGQHPFYSFLLTAKISSWLQTFSVLFQSLTCGYKLYKYLVKYSDNRGILRLYPSPDVHKSASSILSTHSTVAYQVNDFEEYRQLNETPFQELIPTNSILSYFTCPDDVSESFQLDEMSVQELGQST